MVLKTKRIRCQKKGTSIKVRKFLTYFLAQRGSGTRLDKCAQEKCDKYSETKRILLKKLRLFGHWRVFFVKI
jgi:hypothetical protein